jgi:signal transduction histidine kinase/transcriptional regulator with GAF, ATPase, and Fis domain
VPGRGGERVDCRALAAGPLSPQSTTPLLGALHEISAAASRTLDPSELVALVAARAAELLGADAVALYLWDESAGMLLPVYSNDTRARAPDQPIRPGTGAAGIALARREPIGVADYQAWRHGVDWARERGLRAVEAVPLMVADQAIGALVARFYSPRTLAAEDLRTLSLLAAQMAPALEAARLYARVQWERERERALREVTQALAMNLDEKQVLDLAVRHATSLLSAPYGRVWLMQSNGELGCAAAEGYLHDLTYHERLARDSVSGLAAQSVVLNLPDAPAHPAWQDPDFAERTTLRAYLGAGIRRAGASLGVLEIMRELGRPFSSAEEELAISLANAVAVAVSNARMHAATARLARRSDQRAQAEQEASQRRLAFLAEASQVLASSLEYEATLQSIVQLATPTLADVCIVDVLESDGGVRRIASSHADPVVDEWLRTLPHNPPLDLDGPHPIARTLRTGEASFLFDLGDAPPVDSGAQLVSGDPDVVPPPAIADTLRFASGLVVPLVARTGLLGAITCLTTGDRHLTNADLSLAQDLARRCALAMDNARLYREARDAISVRDEFLSVAAHELKTPLTSLRGYAQLLVRDFDRGHEIDPQRGRRSARTIMLQADKLSRLITQLLDVSRIQAGQLAIDCRPTNLVELVQQAVDDVRPQLGGHAPTIRLPGELLAVVDPLRFEQVIANLLDNAIKFSPEGGPIEVELWGEGQAACLAVRDHGLGIAVEDREHIFDRFYQGRDRTKLTNLAGMGLGLYISRQIIELHRGSIRAEFPPDGGTRFVVRVPLGEKGAPKAVLSTEY